MSGTGASLNDKIDLAPWGNRPGSHFFTCNECSNEDPRDALHFGDHRNTRCIKHALEARQREIRILEQDYRDPEDIVAEMILHSCDQYNCKTLFIAAFMAACLIAGALIFGH